ncbi:MAG: F0F1 ATP synthase subunit B [Saccharofermentans sp.]|nr:F0F1 ATP synthase subunit B [Saccharofermentans sp.]
MTLMGILSNPAMLGMMAVAEETAQESSLFSPDQFAGYAVTAVITIVNVIVAYIIIKLFVYKPISKAIKNREALIKSQVEEAQKSNEEAKEYAATSKQAIDDARVQASGIIEEAKDSASKQSEVIISKANEDAANIIARAEEEAKRMKKAALDEMKDEISDLAVAIASRVLGDVMAADKIKTLANNYTNEVLKEEVNKIG